MASRHRRSCDQCGQFLTTNGYCTNCRGNTITPTGRVDSAAVSPHRLRARPNDELATRSECRDRVTRATTHLAAATAQSLTSTTSDDEQATLRWAARAAHAGSVMID